MASSRLVPITSIVVLLAAAGGYYYYHNGKQDQALPTYKTVLVDKGSIRQMVTATGQLDAVLSVDVGSQISGLVVKLHADFNTVVKKDQIIAEIDPATYEQRLRQAEADLASARASNRLQQLNTDRTRELFDKSLVTQQERDQAEAQLAQSNAQLLTREAAVENANVDLARCTIRSPIDGIVISKQTEEGKTVAASLNAPTLFTIANDLSKMQITAAVAEADIGSVREGQSVSFTVDAFPNSSFNGSVTQVRNAPKTTSNVVTYDTIINVDNRDLKLRPGMTANVSVIVASRDNSLRVPNSALRVRLPENSGVNTEIASNSPSSASAPATPGTGNNTGERRQRGEGGGGGGGAEGGGRRGGGGGGGFLSPDATPEQREQFRAIMTEVGITNFREATPEQRDQLRKLLVEQGLAPAPAALGEAVIITRTIYRLPGGDKTAIPVPVSVKIGITDGIVSEVISDSGLNEGDTIITGIALPGSTTSSTQRTSNPFSGGGGGGRGGAKDTMASVVQLEDIHKIYDSGEIPVHAVRGVGLTIEAGEFVAVMGSSGSGKSTMMNLLGCLDRPTKGRYLLDGTDVSGLDRNALADLRNQKLGFVFQGFNLLSRTMARENVELPMLYGRHRLTSREIHERALRSLDIVGLSNRADHFPNQLSGGQQQRVAIARALINEPQILLADEPTGNLDSKTSIEIMGVFQKLNEQGITIVMVTHELDIARYCKRNLIMRDGLVVSDIPVPDRLIAAVEMKRILDAEVAAKLSN